jgi:hypothetical protein
VVRAETRFRLAGFDSSRPYLQDQVDLLAEDTGDEMSAGLAAQAVRGGVP